MRQPKMKDSQMVLLDLIRETGGMTRLEIEHHFGICDTSVTKRVHRLKARGLIRIGAYVRTAATPAAVYVLADGKPDAPKLPPVPHQERQRKYREKHAVRIAARRYGTRTRFANPYHQLLQQ